MFISINKKILISIFAFLFFISAIFFVIFFNVYARQLQEGQNQNYSRNQYIVDLLFDNIALRKELSNLIERYPYIEKNSKLKYLSIGLNLTQEELSNEQRLNAEMKKNYNNNYTTFIAGVKILGFSFFIIILLIFLLIFLLNYWVIVPMERLTNISQKVSQGIFSSRLQNDSKKIKDEFDVLSTVFNQMLENIETNIKKIKTREQFLQHLIDAVPEAIRVIDNEHNIVMANLALHRLFKLKKSCLSEKCYNLYGYQNESCPQSKYKCPFKEIIELGHSHLNTIHEVNGTPLYVSSAKLQSELDEKKSYVVEAIHDLSADVQYSHQQKVSSLAFLSTSVAHEMKNNLGAIRMIFEELLGDENHKISPEEQKKYMQLAYNQLVETIKTPERLLRLSQFSQADTSQINVSSAIEDMLLMVDYDAKRRGVNIEKNLDKNAVIYDNEADFKMIILNLTQNAIKAMPDGGVLTVTANKQKNKVLIKISDTGIGISEEQIKHIFEPFYSANSSAKSSGLGLAIVKNLVDRSKGTIKVRSKLNRGTTFEIILPLPHKNRLSVANS